MPHSLPSPRAHNFGIAVIALFLMACGACSCGNPFSGLMGGNDTNVNTAGADFGQVVMAGAIGNGAAPQDIRTDFDNNDPIIYVVADVNRLDNGTTLFARWSRDGSPFEDTPTITANQDYTDTYVEFHIEPESGNFESGDYNVQIYVNGNPGPEVDFKVN